MLKSRHGQDVVVPAVAEDRLAPDAFMAETGLFVAANAARVEIIHIELDAVQVQLAKRKLEDGTGGVGAVTLTPIRLFAQRDAKVGKPVLPFNTMQTVVANVDPLIPDVRLDAEEIIILAAEPLLEPTFLHGHGHRFEHQKILAHLWIIEPAHERRQIRALDGP